MPARNRRSVLLGEALRQARTAADITQEELGFVAKLDRTYISHVENGRESPTVDVLFRTGPVLGITASQLISQVERSLESRRK